MTVSCRKKLTLTLLLTYWPTLFILAHIPIPQLVREVGVSDKNLHFTAYLILVFLLWFAINPDRKVSWRKITGWWVFAVAVCYGIFDELMQGIVTGRSCDAMDFLADVIGMLTGLTLFAFFTFWPAFLVVTGITIFALTNLTRVNLADFLPVTYLAFNLFAYGFFAMLWIQNMNLFLPFKAPKLKWLIAASALPICFLAAVKLFSVAVGRDFRWQDVITATAGIVAVVITIYLLAIFRCRRIAHSADT
jgi:VanZ family protein